MNHPLKEGSEEYPIDKGAELGVKQSEKRLEGMQVKVPIPSHSVLSCIFLLLNSFVKNSSFLLITLCISLF